MRVDKKTLLLILGILIVLVASCAANNTRYDEVPAGFWAGLWHGLIIVVAFIISLFTDSVSIYEVNNTGGWYNFGYVFGLMIALSHGGMWEPVKKKKAKSAKEAEWEEIGVKVEEKVKTGIQNWVNETNQLIGILIFPGTKKIEDIILCPPAISIFRAHIQHPHRF